ncbi:hypothetical protein [Isoptericola sp. NPDC057559]|uniref:hypothetical protein n=1 Tax=Isoptericola sp. NPDC057559 TaxID=3346168 RepID=UPI0036A00C93
MKAERGAGPETLAQKLLAAWGGVAGLATARPEELAREAGVGPAKAARIAAAFAVGSRRSRETDEVRLATSEDVARAAHSLIGTSATEKVAVLVVDGGYGLKLVEVVAVGTAKACPMPVREILALVRES